MSTNRFRLPAPPEPEVSLEAFVVMPLAALPSATPEQVAAMKQLYERAFAEALAVAGPSLLERDLLGEWN